jgi:hypothetical protein
MEAKIEIKIGQIHFSGEGSQDWVAKQLDKVMAEASKLIKLAPSKDAEQEHNANTGEKQESGAQKTLPAFLGEKNAKNNQVKTFLATAVWLHDKGQSRLKSADVTSALKKSNQKKLSNASQCLKQNTVKGFCEKDGDSFFVTEDGRNSL